MAALKRKPGAFARWVLRDAVFPRDVYRRTWERLAAARPEREACKTMVGLLALAADGHEAQLADELEQLIELDQLPDLNALTAFLPLERLGARRARSAQRGATATGCITSAKKSLPLSSTTMKAGKSSTSIRQTASMPSSGYSSTST